jgi:hypothetical protein
METKWRATGCDYTIDYMNPMIDSCHWPEWEKYKSEWTIFDWYERNEINEYHCNIVPSRIDKLMYDALFSLKLGIRAIYYDCFEQSRDWNYIMNDAVARTEGGSVRNAVNRFFAWREIAKRTATLCYLNGGMAFGRPFTELHATSFQVIPVLSFMSTALMMERGSRGGEFQERYNESYLLTDIVCRQSGAVPRLIVTTVTGDDERKHRELKSLFGLMCAIGVFALQDQGIVNADWFDRAWNIVFDAGWGKPGSEMHWYYDGKVQVDESDAEFLDLPMAVLVNSESISAAEFFAAALDEYEAATVVGEQTIGKGYFQQAYKLSDGSAVGLSVGKYTTPNGVSLTGVGITPDVVVEVDDELFWQIYYGNVDWSEDPQILAAMEVLKKAE